MDSWTLGRNVADVRPAREVAGRSRRRASSDGKIAALEALPLLRPASPRELELIAQAGDRIDVPAGSSILGADAHNDWVYLLLDGTAGAGAPDLRFGAGDWLGALAYLAHEPALMTVTATSELRALTISANRFAALLETVPTLRRAVINSLAYQLARSIRPQAPPHQSWRPPGLVA